MQNKLRIMFLCFVAAAATLSAATPKYSAAANFAVDLKGEPDNRPGTWGTTGSVVWTIHFTVPPAYRVRILRVYGDFLVWPRGHVSDGTYAGALFSLQTSAPEGSKVADLMADNCFLYVQVATGGKPERASFDNAVSAGGLLASDNALYVKVAVWLNDTGLAIHMEPTWVTVLQVEDASGSPVDIGAGVSAFASRHGENPRRIAVRCLK